MTRLAHLALALATVGVVLAAGTGAFTATSAERGVEVAVADDPSDALLGLETHRVELDNGRSNPANASNASNATGQSATGPPGLTREVELLTVENHFGQELTTVAVQVDDGGDGSPPKLKDHGSVAAPDHLDAGDSGAVTAEVVCSNGNENVETWTVDVEARGDSVSVDTTVEVTVACTGDPPA